MKNYKKLAIYLALVLLAVLVLVVKNKFFSQIANNHNIEGENSQQNPSEPDTASSTIVSDIIVSQPTARQEIFSPLEITGQARGGWFFEAIFSAKLTDSAGQELGVGLLTAQSDWMTNNFVPFSGEIEFINPGNGSGYLVLKNANPSGLPENEKQFIVPVVFGSAATTTVKVYFNNNELDPAISCDKVFATERIINKTLALARVAITELLKGPDENEVRAGYYTNISQGVSLKKITIENGVAQVNFSEELNKGVAGSCKVSAIRAQITKTLLQFPTVKNVVIAVDGKTDDILQP